MPAEPRIDHKEIVGLRTETRELTGLVRKLLEGGAPSPAKPASPAAPAPAYDDTRARLDLADAMDDAGVAFGKDQKALIKRLFQAEKPTNARDWLAETVKILPSAPAPAAPVATPVTPPTAPSNTGAPTAPLQNELPPDPRQWPADVVRKMSVEDWRKAMDAYRISTGQGDPLRALRPKR